MVFSKGKKNGGRIVKGQLFCQVCHTFRYELAHWLKKYEVSSLFKRKRGVSLILTVLLSSLILFFSAGIYKMIVVNKRNIIGYQKSTQAMIAAKGSLDFANRIAKYFPIGTTFTQEYWVGEVGGELVSWVGGEKGGTIFGGTNSVNSDNNQPIKGAQMQKFEVYGTTKIGPRQGKVSLGNNKEVFVLPGPYMGSAKWTGPGKVLSGEGCDPFRPPKMQENQNGRFWDFIPLNSQNTIKNIPESEHPCNWGVLRVAEQVSLPLFAYEKDCLENNTFSVNNCQEVKASGFRLRIRTVCANGEEYCNPEDRELLDCVENLSGGYGCENSIANPSQQGGKGEVVVNWQIEEEGGKVLLANVNEKSEDNKGGFDKNNNSTVDEFDTQLNEGWINKNLADGGNNNLMKFYVLDSSKHWGKIVEGNKVKLDDFLNNNNVKKPKLKLSVVAPLKSCGKNGSKCGEEKSYQNFMPYLEYQLELDFNGSDVFPVGSHRLIRGSANVDGGYTINLSSKFPVEGKGVEYAIQQ